MCVFLFHLFSEFYQPVLISFVNWNLFFKYFSFLFPKETKIPVISIEIIEIYFEFIFYFLRSFLCCRLSTFIVILSMKNDSFISSFTILYLSFPCLITWARMSSTILNGSDDKYIYLFLDLKRKFFYYLSIKNNVCCMCFFLH